MKERIIAMLDEINNEKKLERVYWFVMNLLMKGGEKK